MSLFEFVITLYSIVIALSVARALTGIVGIIEYRKDINHASLFIIWLLYLLLVQVVWWFSIWGMNAAQSISLGRTLFLFHVPACLFIAARLLVPSDSELDSMSDRYTRLRVPFLVFLALPAVPGPLFSALSTGDWSIAMYLVPIGGIMLLSLPFSGIRVQYAVAATSLAIYAAFAVHNRSELAV